MALFDFLKRKKEIEKAKEGQKTAKKPVPAKVATGKPVKKTGKVLDKKAVVLETSSKKTKREFSYQAVNQPHISEKSRNLSDNEDRYTFKVSPNYNKSEIKNAVEGIYGVDVLSVNISKIPPKKRRLGKTQGFKKGLIKAIVKIKKGQKIEIL